MALTLNDVDRLLQVHFQETSERLVDSPPSQLRRGEGTEKNFFILKIDLVGSTRFLRNRRQSTYLRLAHTFLSTVDRITQDYGADGDQVEYAGDGVMAYFPQRVDAAAQVLEAAFYCKAAVDRISSLDGAVAALHPRCRLVIHFAALTVARIGPRSGSMLSAIGFPLHTISKLEDKIGADVGRATPEFFRELPLGLRKYLLPITETQQVLVEQPPVFPFGFQHSVENRLVDALLGRAPTPPPAQYRTETKTIGYNVSWPALGSVLR
jgi:class 3 adenylate cyclase